MKRIAILALIEIVIVGVVLLFFVAFVALFGDPGCETFVNLTLCKE